MSVVHRLTPAEVVEILDGLHARLDARPGLALDPSFMGLVRLAVTASPTRPAAPAPVYVPPPVDNGPLLQAQGRLTDALALCAEQANEIAALKAEIASLRAARAGADDDARRLRDALDDARAPSVELVGRLKSLEFAGAGSGMRHPRTKQPLPACPACSFVDPEVARGLRGVTNTGHAPGCAMSAALEQAAALVAALG